MPSDYIDARLPEPLAEHVARMVGPYGLFNSPDEYIRALIRQDMEQGEAYRIRESIREGYRDLGAGRCFLSTGDFARDRKIFEQKEVKGWS